MTFTNVYEDEARAASYAGLAFPGTYYLAYRDLPRIIREHAKGATALDFGCGTGRSTRFVRDLNFDTAGVDISESMLKRALEADPGGKYYPVPDGDLSLLKDMRFDLITSIFTFDNINPPENKVSILRQMGALLNDGGIIVNLVSSPLIYTHEWVSFSTKDFPENRTAKSGDRVKIIMTDVPDRRPVVDIMCSGAEYGRIYKEAGLQVVETYSPLGRFDEDIEWINETRISPWVIDVLKREGNGK